MATHRGWWCLFLLLSLAPRAAADDRRLVEAAKNRNAAVVRALLDQQLDVNTSQPDGSTALHWATHWGDRELVQRLIQAGARVNAATDLGVTPLAIACTNGDAATVKALLAAAANPNVAQPTGETPLMTCSRTGNVDAVLALIERGAAVDAKETTHGQTALMWAVAEDHRPVVGALLQHGADINARSSGGFTPLMFAAREGTLEIARTLMAAGANVNDVASDGSTPLLLATVRGQLALVDMLLDKGADPNQDTAGFTALHWAAGSWETTLTGAFGIHAKDTEWSVLGGLTQPGKVKLVRSLLARGANPNAQIKKQPPRFGFTVFALRLPGATPFLLAALAADVEVMRILLASGADSSLVTNEGTTALMVAAGTGRAVGEARVTESSALEAAKLALQVGGNVNTANKNGDTALHGAAGVGADRMVAFLVENGAAVNVANKNGRTPLDAAMGRGAIYYESTAALLRRFGATEGAARAATTDRRQ